MTTWHVNDVLGAAVQSWINDRCRRAYIHDMRGGLHALYASFEVLARSAKSEQPNVALIDKASTMAKRALTLHEQAATDIIDQLTGPNCAAEIVNLPQLVQLTQQFLRNDALSRGITLRLSGSDTAPVLAQRNQLRMLILGLLALCIDASRPGTEVHVEMTHVDCYALLELRCDSTYGPIRGADELLRQDMARLLPEELVLAFARQWVAAKGGRVEIHSPPDSPSGLRIYYPLAAG